ncbi:hypothetical protein Csa_012641 [Cucumis sativus]|uniref:Uncharacterized protein n=1 Tax=Cucumis sativus TaxID=3659 RepID=A0A0A0L4N5_CUCSA|nr:hypothetical protein Csa_012641 [Cucumis sativus]
MGMEGKRKEKNWQCDEERDEGRGKHLVLKNAIQNGNKQITLAVGMSTIHMMILILFPLFQFIALYCKVMPSPLKIDDKILKSIFTTETELSERPISNSGESPLFTT